MNINKKIAKILLPFTLGLAASVAVPAVAYDWESCFIDCLERKRICYAAAANGIGNTANCDRIMRLCRWGCGRPQ